MIGEKAMDPHHRHCAPFLYAFTEGGMTLIPHDIYFSKTSMSSASPCIALKETAAVV